ncbi:MAG TPA: DUF4105 domain-containing protein [Methylococcaceae bacterium]|jgi:hypothetical protein|nr:DUF4105 domain-containing protein [Methylococcaceae bacterium]
MKLACWLIAGLLAPLLCLADASSNYLSVLQQRALSQRLDRDEGWLALGHYREAKMSGGFVSDADDSAFFLAKAGKRDPRAELLATLAAFFRPGAGDGHPQCRFPARYHWLKSHLAFDGERLAEQQCAAFREWRDTLQAHAISLIFPAAYMNSPSSMFGHTFLRLDRVNQNDDNVLLAYTINYAAEAVDENELFYAYRGLFGGYPGVVTVQPFYDKVKEYRDWENRDIWEYNLNLAPTEVAQLVRHVWEIKPVRFDYFFIDENCSYRLLSLLDVARPGLALRRGFPYRSIPVDTVRAVLAGGLVKNTSYRPSAVTTLKAHRRQLTSEQRRLARQLALGKVAADSPVLIGLAPNAQAAILETAYELCRYRALDEKLPREAIAKTSYQLLRARSRIDVPSPLAPPHRPAIRDDEGHKPQRAGLGFGFFDHRAYGEISFRSAYHDLTDPRPGYQEGAQIKFLDGSLRYYEDWGLKLERLDVLSIKSISARDDFLKPVSWGVEFGAYRKLLRDGRPLVGYLSGETGLAYEIGGGLAYGSFGAALEVGDTLEDGVQLGLGPRLGWLYQGLGGQGMLNFGANCFFASREYCGGKLALEHTVNLGREFALRLNLSRERGQGRYASEVGLSLQHFF